jgi:hypothetical protein
MRTIKSCLFLFSLAFYLGSVQAQNAPNTKWGKVTPEEWKITRCTYDTSANAVVLFDKGDIQFNYGRAISINRHKRIKILSTKGLDEANVSIPFYFFDNLEKISNVDAQTINVDGSGKAVIQKVENSQVFENKVTDKWKEKSFSFPSVKVGSIIEFRYTTLSQSYRFLDGWVFQNNVPTLYSEFKAAIPEHVSYHFLINGARLLQKYREATNTWSLTNLTALRKEPYVNHYMDYAEKIQFQLAGYTKIDNGTSSYENLTTSWEKLAVERLEDENFTRYLNRHGLAKDIVGKMLIGNEPDLEKMKKLYHYVQRTLRWNGKYLWFTQNPLPNVLESGEANSAEINLFLTLLLRQSGLEAHPVMISTRQHGKVFRNYPFMEQFNHLLANVQIQGKDYQLDATDRYRPYDQLNEDALVGFGFLLDKKAPRWIENLKPTDTRQAVFIEADLSNLNRPQYKVNLRYTGHLAVNERKTFDDPKKENILKHLSRLHPADYQIDNLEIIDVTNIENPLVLTYTLSAAEPDDSKKDFLYINPLVVNHLKENPYKNESRFLPVELGYPQNSTLTISLKIPEGYEVQELPAGKRLAMPAQMGEFTYMANQANGLVQIRTSIVVKQPTIPSEYYLDLREFYTQIISKYSEQIVLKKTAR